ncbi:hypothetical protein KM043_002001 [Ampulex compressa]|nr:hypothetical protein KM043_002001 [Ampulex compressa]
MGLGATLSKYLKSPSRRVTPRKNVRLARDETLDCRWPTDARGLWGLSPSGILIPLCPGYEASKSSLPLPSSSSSSSSSSIPPLSRGRPLRFPAGFSTSVRMREEDTP